MKEYMIEFSAYNQEKQYGYGTIDQALLYLDYLNLNKEYNLFEYQIINLTEGEFDLIGFDLSEALSELDLSELD